MRNGVLDCLCIAGEAWEKAEDAVVHSPAYGNRSSNTDIGGFGQRRDNVVAHALGVLFFKHCKQTGCNREGDHPGEKRGEKTCRASAQERRGRPCKRLKVCDELAALKSDGRHFLQEVRAEGASARMLSGRRYLSKQWVARWWIITHRNEKSKLNSCGCARYRPAGALGPRIAAQSPAPLRTTLSRVSEEKERPHVLGTVRPCMWCPGPESNRHALRRGILSPLRLPISPPGQARKRSRKLWHSNAV